MRRLLRGRTTFLVISATQRGIPFLLLPVFVGALSPSQYGQVGVLTAAFGIGSLTFGLGQELVSYRYFYATDIHDLKTRDMSALMLILTPFAFAAVTITLILCFSPDLGGTPPIAIAGSVGAAALYVSAWQFVAVELRCTDRVGLYFAYSIAYTGTVAAVKLVLILVLDTGVVGWAVSDLVAATLLSVFTTPFTMRAVNKGLANRSGTGSRMAVKLGLPIFSSQVATSLAGFSDRIFSIAILSASTAGGYVLAAQLVSIGSVFMNELSRFLQPRISRRDVTLKALLRDIIPKHSVYVLAVWVGVASIAQAFVVSGFAGDYPDVALTAAGLSLLLPFLGFNNIAHDLNAIYIGNTRWGAGVSVFMSIVALGSNFVLIHAIGIWGAVITAVGVQVLTSLLLWTPILRFCRREPSPGT